MLKEIIGALASLFVLLPFLFINSSVVRIRQASKRRFIFFLVNIIQVAMLSYLAYCLYFVGQQTLYGLIIVVSVFLFLELMIWIVIRKKYARLQEEEEESIDFANTQSLSSQDIKEEYSKTADEDTISLDKEQEDLVESEAEEDIIVVEEELILKDDPATKEVAAETVKTEKNKEVIETLEDIFRMR